MVLPNSASTPQILNKPSWKAALLPSTTSADKARLYEELEHMFAEREKMSAKVSQQTELIIDKIIFSTVDRIIRKVGNMPSSNDLVNRLRNEIVLECTEEIDETRDEFVRMVNKRMRDKNLRVLDENFCLDIAIRDMEKRVEKEVIGVFVDAVKLGAERDAKKEFTEMFAEVN